MKGIILAGGSGSRLAPLTHYTNKQLLPVYNKPMIYYALSTLLLADIREILIIASDRDISILQRELGNGELWKIDISYAVQLAPNGIAEALVIGEEFIDISSVCLLLGDNIFVGEGFTHRLSEARKKCVSDNVAVNFGVTVRDPRQLGVLEVDTFDNVISIEEKPLKPKSNIASTGLYMFPSDASRFAKGLRKSSRGELEITDLLQTYLQDERLKVELFGRGFLWKDMGTIENLYDASVYVRTLEKMQGLTIGCIEEILYTKGHLSKSDVGKILATYKPCAYRELLETLIK